jgi:transposase
MAQPLSMDLRTRVLSAVAEGASGRSAGRRFGVSAPSVSRWRALERAQGDAAPKAVGGDRRSRETEAHAATILLAIEATADLTLEELRAELAKDGVFVSYGALWRFLDRHKITRKKSPRTPANRNVRTS